MGRTCREIHEWIEEEVEKPIEEWEDRQEERCREEPCKWWMLCLNKLFCWLVWVTVKVVRWVVVTVGKWVTRVVCTVVNVILDVIGFIVGLILSIPVIGGIIRTVLNWVTEIIWRIVGLVDLLGYAIGIRPRKKMYFSVIIPEIDGVPLMPQSVIDPWVQNAIDIYDQSCNIDLRFTGYCQTSINPPGGELDVACNAGGFFRDWWLLGSWFEFVTKTCKFESNWRGVIGLGAEIHVFVVQNIPNALGCSMGPTHNYVTIEMQQFDAAGNLTSTPFPDTIAHEIGHACGLTHTGNTGGTNLMDFGPRSGTISTLSGGQAAIVRWSRFCTYI